MTHSEDLFFPYTLQLARVETIKVETRIVCKKGGRFNLYYSLQTKALEAATTKHELTTSGSNRTYSGAEFSFFFLTVNRNPFNFDKYISNKRQNMVDGEFY